MSKTEKPHVLLADDNEATCTLVRALLHREFTVDVVFDGNEALEALRTKQYAVILLDLRMPNVDGFDVLQHLRGHSPQMLKRVLILTASLSRGELARAKEFDTCGIIEKPFEVEELLSAVRRCAGADDGASFSTAICASTPVILLLADLLRQLR